MVLARNSAGKPAPGNVLEMFQENQHNTYAGTVLQKFQENQHTTSAAKIHKQVLEKLRLLVDSF